jgi:hypothetical protein
MPNLGGIPLSGRKFLRGRIAKVVQIWLLPFYQTPRSHNRRVMYRMLLLCSPNVNSMARDIIPPRRTLVTSSIGVELKCRNYPSAKPAYAQTANFFAVVQAGMPLDVQAAISNGADVNARDSEESTPLMGACYYQRNEVIIILLKAGADINAQDAFGHSALMWAAMYNEVPDTITTLLDAGADAKLKDKKGQTAFDYAKLNWRLKDTEAYRRLQEASE